MIEIKVKKECCGCNACVLYCPCNCIIMKNDHEGFLYPDVNIEVCNDCGLCEEVCPVLKKTSVIKDRFTTPKVFAAWNKNHEIRLDSTSGGIFSALADKIFDQNGYVAGAVYEDDHTVSHIVTNNKKKLSELRSSKYLQSYTRDLYKNIDQLLSNKRKVFVCATPCQIAALYNYIGGDHDNLITCDFICRGVNSPKVFLKYIDMLEQQYSAPVKKIKFKNKTFGWHRFSTLIEFENGKKYLKDRHDDSFMRGYLRTNSFARPSCYECRFKDIPRNSDITLADFWGIEKIKPELDNNCGTSLVLLNSNKGTGFFKNTEKTIFYEELAINDALADNQAIFKSIELKHNRKDFFNDIDVMTFSELAEKYFPKPGYYEKIRQIFIISKGKRMLKKLLFFYKKIGLNPTVWYKLIHFNLLRKNTNQKIRLGFLLTRYCAVKIDKSSRIIMNGKLDLGLNEFKNSRIETRLSLGSNSSLIVNNKFTVYAGSDIRVTPNAMLTLNGGFCNNGVQITCGKKITIGKGCAIARDAIIRDYDAHQILHSDHQISKEIIIGDNVWIGNRAMILKGVTIGQGAVIAAGAIVTKDIPEKCLAAGVPAVVIRENIEWK